MDKKREEYNKEVIRALRRLIRNISADKIELLAAEMDREVAQRPAKDEVSFEYYHTGVEKLSISYYKKEA